MPHKICPECKKGHGPRKITCDCGYAFVKTSKADSSEMITASPKKKPKFQLVGGPIDEPPFDPDPETEDDFEFDEEEFEEEKTPQFGRVLKILTPSGYPPVKPKGYAGTCERAHYHYDDPWPDGQPSDDEIVEWASKITDIGIKDDRIYSIIAILYYARHFWEYNTPEFNYVRGVLRGCLGFRPRF